MKITLTPEMTFEAVCKEIQTMLPQYETSIKTNPVARFQYIEVKKSGSVGVWIRIFEKKGRMQLMKAMPSAMVRAFFGGLLLLLFVNGAQNRIRKEVGDVIINKFNGQYQ